MLILPRSNPLYENLAVQKVNLPDAMKKMGAGGFTGYLGYGSNSSEGYFIFIKGALISALMLEGTSRKSGFEAFTSLFTHTLLEGGVINVYRMTVDLAVCTQALLHGTVIAKPDLVSNLDLKTVLHQIKLQAINGTVLFSTAERSAMIFYKEGTPIGFYHDAAKEVETSSTESERVAALPNARIEIRSTPPAEELLHHNFLETLNIDRLWQASLSRHTVSQPSVTPPTAEAPPVPAVPAVTEPPPTPAAQPVPEIPPLPQESDVSENDDAQLTEIVDDLQEIAKAYLGRQGADLVDSLIDLIGGKSALRDSQKVIAFLAAMAAQAPDIDPEAKIEEMVDLMRSEIAGRLSV